MRKLYLLLALSVFSLMAFQGCSPKTGAGALALKRANVTGNWLLTNITFEQIPEVAVRSFLGESSYKCFIGSTWTLTNSGNGSYSLPQSASCSAYTQSIFWSVSTADETFQFKKLNEGDKAKNVTDGYRLLLSSANGDEMTLRSPVEYGNGGAYIVLHFAKTTK